MKRICRFLPLGLLLCGIQAANAQSVIDVNVGFGAAQAKAGPGFDVDNSVTCGPLTTTCAKTPSLNSFFMGVGFNMMLWEKLGFGMAANFQPGKQDYVDFGVNSFGYREKYQSRVTFYDFNAIYQPVRSNRANLQLIGGIGGANVRFYYSQAGSGGVLGNSSYSQAFGSSNHFQVHGGVGVQVYLTDKVFVRPQFDIRYVPNFEQFGTNRVLQQSVWLGYTIGDRP